MPTKKATKDDRSTVSCCENYKTCPQQARMALSQRLFTPQQSFFIQDLLKDEREQLKVVVEQCITAGESNSVLVIGPRGSGKSQLVQQVLEEMDEEFADNYIPVNLSGAVHTDDRLALKDMARQLELENVVGDRVFGSFADNLAFLLDSLKQSSEETKSIVIILDEFDGFTSHKNQSLLYNLFDIAQSRQSPLCVIGITTRLDVVELLEKRVKSRYSHRVILTFPKYTFEEYVDMLKQLLTLPTSFPCSYFKRKWDQNVKVLLDEADVRELLERHYSMHKDLRNAIKLFVVPLTSIGDGHAMLTADDVKVSYRNLHRDTKVQMLCGLSILELCLVVAAQHVNERREGQPFNFEMVFNEYQAFARRRLQGMQHFNRAVTIKAYEHLESLELFKQTERGAASVLGKEYKHMFMLVNTTQIHEALEAYPDCPTELKNWADYVYT